MHEFVGPAAGGIVPVHETVTVWPTDDGTVTVCEAGVEAPARPTPKTRAAAAEAATRCWAERRIGISPGRELGGSGRRVGATTRGG